MIFAASFLLLVTGLLFCWFATESLFPIVPGFIGFAFLFVSFVLGIAGLVSL